MVKTIASIYYVGIKEDQLTVAHLPHPLPETGQSGGGGAGAGPSGGGPSGGGPSRAGPSAAGDNEGQGTVHPQSVQEVDEVQTATLRSLLDLKRSLDQSAQQAEQTRLSLLQLHQDVKGSLLGVHQELQHRLIQQAEVTMWRMQSLPHLISLPDPSGGTFQSSFWVHQHHAPIVLVVSDGSQRSFS